MKEFKGTPGNWKLSMSARAMKAHISGQGWETHTKIYLKTQEIDGSYTRSEEGMANAQLIATAPELLEALQIMVGYGHMCPSDKDSEHAKLTINKALGL